MPRIPFGGQTISFKGREETIEDVMGSKPMPPTQMMKSLWDYVKKNDLLKKKESKGNDEA